VYINVHLYQYNSSSFTISLSTKIVKLIKGYEIDKAKNNSIYIYIYTHTLEYNKIRKVTISY